MIKIAVCDEEEFFMEWIEEFFTKYFRAKNICYGADIFDSEINLLEKEELIGTYDIIFFNISMRGKIGIEVAMRIKESMGRGYLILLAESMLYAAEGYKVSAFRYLIKHDNNWEAAMEECLDTIVQQMQNVEEAQVFEFLEGRKRLPIHNIIYIESNLHKLNFYVMQNGIIKYSMYEKLDVIEELLCMSEFCRIHKSFLVNLRYVDKVQRYKAILSVEKELNVAKPRYKEVENAYMLFKESI